MSAPTRRQLLTRTGVAGLAGLAGVAGLGGPAYATGPDTADHRSKTHRKGPATFVFVPGSAATAFYWQRVAQPLALAGHRTVSVDLPGHGLDSMTPSSYQAPQDLITLGAAPDPLGRVGLADTVRTVAPIVRRAAEHGPVVLVGHSLGGATVSRVADAVPDQVDHLVYISAVCATAMRSVADYLGTPEAKSSLLLTLPPTVKLDPALAISRTNWRTNDDTFLEAYRAAVFADSTPEQLLTYMATTHQPDESIRLNTDDARGRAQTWGRVRRTYVRLTQDRSLPIALQDRWIREADQLTPRNQFRQHTIRGPHGAPISHATQIVPILDRLAQELANGT